MDMQNEKCVMIIDEELPLGLIANTAGILGLTLGKHIPDAIGPDVSDKNGYSHLGIIQFPVPILKAGKDKLKAIRSQLQQTEFSELIIVDFSDVAQGCKAYDDFIEKLSRTDKDDLTYLGLALCGPKKLVNKISGSLPLLR